MSPRAIEPPDYSSFARRIVHNLGRRIRESGDVEALQHLVDLQTLVDAELAESVRALRAEQGYSWADVGRVLGIKRQTAQERFGS